MKTRGLIDLLKQCYRILSAHEEYYWSGKIQDLLDCNELDAAQKVMSWYGGMGSFNDVYLCKENGHKFYWYQSEQSVNKRLNKLREEIYTSARKL